MTSGIQTRPTGSHYRWVICALLFWVTTANYIDRGVFGNLAPELRKTIGWTDEDYWNMQVAFNAAYAVSLLVMGRVMDLLGLRWGFVLACALWGLASLAHALAPEIGGLFGSAVTGFFICRVLLGLGEGGNFPAAIKTTAEWFPRNERALATGLFNSGSNIGGILVPWGLPFIVAQFSALTLGGVTVGWRGAFVLTALVDLGWIVAWLALYKKPEDHPRVSAAELALIQNEPPQPAAKIPWRKLLPHRQTWAFCVAKGMTDCFWWFYLFGSPDFFNKKFGLGPEERKYMIMLIYVVASVGSITGGWLAGRLMQQGWTLNRARKTTLFICAACVLPVAWSAMTRDKWVAAALITLAGSAHQAWSANAFSLASDMFPKRVVGSVTGLGGMVGAVGGIVLFFITGKVLKATGNYLPVFLLASLAYLTALLIVHLLAPKLEPAKVEAA
ncbi:MAG: MFS transporter [Verrucomicrobiota bacterium]|jgi:ACS family hexuronate transporter-like MFS transporter